MFNLLACIFQLENFVKFSHQIHIFHFYIKFNYFMTFSHKIVARQKKMIMQEIYWFYQNVL